jgi:hypothetical protein
MKTSLAHLEFENAQMKRDLAKVRRENRDIEERLVQQEQDNGELTARLDNARNLLRDQGLEPAERSASAREGSDDGGGVKTVPAAQSTRKRRKQPFARIPGQFSPADPERVQGGDEDGFGPPQPMTSPGNEPDPSGVGIDDGLDHHTYYDGPLRWTPIASGTGNSSSQVR